MFSQDPTLSLCLLSSEGSLTDSDFLVPLPCEAGCRQIQDLEIPSVEVDPHGDAQAAAEGAVLGLYEYDDLEAEEEGGGVSQAPWKVTARIEDQVPSPGADGTASWTWLPAFGIRHCLVACLWLSHGPS